MREIIVDNFAGGGGASTGIRWAIGRDVDIAINHDPDAIAMHKVNHPGTKHYCENVWDVDPREAANGRPVALCWLSPDCKHFSKAKGGKPVDKNIRGLAWVAVRWAATVRPRVIILENVEEFKTWGPLLKNGKPDPDRKGRTFQAFINALKRQGYRVAWQELRACDFGAPTTRKRLFLVARCDKQPIIWPQPTHGDPMSHEVRTGRLKPWRAAAEIIDWSSPCPSIFTRKRPLAENTMKRIARGLQKFVIDNPDPYEVNGQMAFVSSYYGDKKEGRDDARGHHLNQPLHTISTANRFALVTSHLVKMKGTNIGQPVTEPVQTITAGGLHFGEVRAFLLKYYGAGVGQACREPLQTITAKHRFGLIKVLGQNYQIMDIGMRMLQPHELFAAQGFPPDYIIDRDAEGNRFTKTTQVARCGNAVPPQLAEALVRANLSETRLIRVGAKP